MKRIMLYKSRNHIGKNNSFESITGRSSDLLFLVSYVCGVTIGSILILNQKGGFLKDIWLNAIFTDPKSFVLRYAISVAAIVAINMILSTSVCGQIILPLGPLINGILTGSSILSILIRKGYPGITIIMRTLFLVMGIAGTVILLYASAGKSLSRLIFQTVSERIRQPIKTYFFQTIIVFVIIIALFVAMYLLLTL